MSHFFRNGNTFRVADDNALDMHKHLPVGNYIVKQDPFKNFFLEMIDGFTQVPKLYGDTQRNSDRIINTFMDRTNSTGVLLNGEKGSGKSLLAKTLSIDCASKWGIPTIVINQPWSGDDFNKLIQDIDQPCVILFDEFEKVYDRETQEHVLTLLDGVFPTKKLFVLTCNDKYRVDSHMRNRPGRIFYMLDFKGLGTDFIREYCHDNLNAEHQSHTDKICNIAMLFAEFNFDMLKALIEEINRYGDTPQEAMRMLNAKPEFSNDVRHTVFLTYKGMEVKSVAKQWDGNPMATERIRFDFCDPTVNSKSRTDSEDPLAILDNDDDEWVNIYFNSSDLVQILPKEGKYEYRQGDAFLQLTRVQEKKFQWDAL